MKDYVALAPIKLAFGRIKVDKKIADRMGDKLRASGDGVYAIAKEVELKGGIRFSADYIPKVCNGLVMEVIPTVALDKQQNKTFVKA